MVSTAPEKGSNGPTFEVYRFEADPDVETATLAGAVSRDHPELGEVAYRVSAFVTRQADGEA
jgi:hypothetical protein